MAVTIVCPNCKRKILADREQTRVAICRCRHRIVHAEYTGDVLEASCSGKPREANDDRRLQLLRALWREIHTYNPAIWDAAVAEAWFWNWLRRVPSFGCSCQEHFRELLADFPPDFSSREAFFIWAVDAHNRVNERLGKNVMPLDEARQMYATE